MTAGRRIPAAVPAGRVATVITTLEMTARPRPRPMPAAPLRLDRWARPSPDAYRTLFARVGMRWLWFSRLALDDAALVAIVHDPAVRIFAATDRAGVEVGMIELDFREPGTALLAYLALVPELTGRGIGNWLIGHALAQAWAGPGVARVRVHTASLDHPGALGFYRRHGFVAVARSVETFVDPRLSGHLPRDAAPQIPLIER